MGPLAEEYFSRKGAKAQRRKEKSQTTAVLCVFASLREKFSPNRRPQRPCECFLCKADVISANKRAKTDRVFRLVAG